MDEVAETAELSKGTLYLYFKSKEELYFGISYRALSLLKKMFEDAVQSHSTGIEKIRAIGRSYYQCLCWASKRSDTWGKCVTCCGFLLSYLCINQPWEQFTRACATRTFSTMWISLHFLKDGPSCALNTSLTWKKIPTSYIIFSRQCRAMEEQTVNQCTAFVTRTRVYD